MSPNIPDVPHLVNRPGGTNGHAHPPNDHAEPIFAVQQTEALAVVRLILGRKVAPKTRKALAAATPTEWGGLAEFVEASTGLEPEALWRATREQYLGGLKLRYPGPAKLILDALTVAWKAAQDQDPGDEPEEKPPRRPFVCAIKGVTEFVRTDYRLTWAVKRILVMGQPCVVGAPKKSMKTSTMFDLFVSLASGTPFLGEFEVPGPVPVLLISGESGGFVMQETLDRVCRAKGVNPIDLEDRLFIGDELPQLGVDADMEALAEFIRDNGIKVVIIDPLYLCLLAGAEGRRLDPSNLFDVGPLLLAVSRTCLSAGATPVLVHHFRKNGADPNDLPELEELAYAGIQEFARQWVLLKRRERFEPGSGVHKLWLAVGGSAGHSGEWALDITEGVMDDNFQGRRWEVSIKLASDARSEVVQSKEVVKTEQQTEKARQKDEAAAKRVRNDAVDALIRLEELVKKFGRLPSKTEWKDGLHAWNTSRFGPAFSFLMENRMAESVPSAKLTAQGKNLVYDGYRPVKGTSQTDPDGSQTNCVSPTQTRTGDESDGLGASSPVGGSPNSESGSSSGSNPNSDTQGRGTKTEIVSPAPPLSVGQTLPTRLPLNACPDVVEDGQGGYSVEISGDGEIRWLGSFRGNLTDDPDKAASFTSEAEAAEAIKTWLVANPAPSVPEVIKPRVEPKATVYITGGVGQLLKEEGVFASAERVSIAQHKDGGCIRCRWRPTGKKNYVSADRDWRDNRYLLVLLGDGHPEPTPGDFIRKPDDRKHDHLRAFDEVIDRHIAETGAEVLVDWRDVTKGDPAGGGGLP